jgi:hypothetical protein
MVRHNVSEGEGQGRSAGGSDSMESVMAAMAQDGDEGRLDGLLLDRMSRYLDTHAISVRLFDDAALEKMRSVNQDVTAKYSHIFAQSGIIQKSTWCFVFCVGFDGARRCAAA